MSPPHHSQVSPPHNSPPLALCVGVGEMEGLLVLPHPQGAWPGGPCSSGSQLKWSGLICGACGACGECDVWSVWGV